MEPNTGRLYAHIVPDKRLYSRNMHESQDIPFIYFLMIKLRRSPHRRYKTMASLICIIISEITPAQMLAHLRGNSDQGGISGVVSFSAALSSHTGRRNGLLAGGVASRSSRAGVPGEKRGAAEDQPAVNSLSIAQIALRKRASFSYEPAYQCHTDYRGDELSARDAHEEA